MPAQFSGHGRRYFLHARFVGDYGGAKMIRICSKCGKNLGEKEPLEDKRITHTLCQKCYDETLREAEEWDA